MIQAGNSETIENYLMGQVEANPTYSTDTATNPNTQFQFYTSAPGLAMEVANKAINNSTAIWPTTVTGGPLVPIQGYGGQAIPAVYAQGYQGTGGTDYVVITNKSPATCTTTIQINGKRVSGQLNVTTVSSASALVANTATAPNTVQIKTTTSTSPVSIGPYSVTVVNW
jgi:alpha-L-arabinofuranosidase